MILKAKIQSGFISSRVKKTDKELVQKGAGIKPLGLDRKTKDEFSQTFGYSGTFRENQVKNNTIGRVVKIITRLL